MGEKIVVSDLDLTEIYCIVKEKVDSIVFEELWPGFKQYDFALYNDSQVILNERIFPKTKEFLANTAIRYQGSLIAIWYLPEEMDLDVLAGKIIHEMFHAYQTECGESRFPEEVEALIKYDYSPLYLQIKYQENLLLATMYERFQVSDFEKFLSLRKRRMMQFPYQYNYESGVDVIEGSAQYVELQVLRKLNQEKYRTTLDECIQRIQDKKNLMPVRILCYDTGAMLLTICSDNDLSVNRKVGVCLEYLLPEEVFRKIVPDRLITADTEMEDFYRTEIQDFRSKIERIIKSSEPVAKGDFELLGVNVYSARYLDGYIYSEYFVRYKAEEVITLYGNYLLRMRQNKIAAVYADERAVRSVVEE